MPHPTHARFPLRRTTILGASALLVCGCATRPPATDPDALAEYRANNDPLEPANRVLYRVNNAIDTAVLTPVAQAYRYVLPVEVRRSVGNAVSNVSSPVAFANDVLQGHSRRAAETLTRFVVNSTVGLGGFFDVADRLGLPPHRGADLGTTLAIWGVGEGPFLFLPVLGPSGVRDATGFAGDIALDPFAWASFGGSTALNVSRGSLDAVGMRERLLNPVDELKRGSLDPYAAFRSAYRQNRTSVIEAARRDGSLLPPPRPLFP